MYIEPNTNIRILKNCPLNSDYQNTIYFDNPENQKNYFIGLTKHRLTKQSFQRVTTGYMRVEIKVEDLYDCNYLMFQNENFGGKWFYAFITSVEYVNNVTSEIGFVIDVMQTWFFDYELLPSFVVREHSATDVIGENTIPENLEHGEYITTATKSFLASDYRIGILSSEQIKDENNADVFYSPQTVGGYPLSCYWLSTNGTNDLEIVKRVLDLCADKGKSDIIIAVFVYPASLGLGSSLFTQNFNGASRVMSKTPRNNKLYTFPYCVQSVVCDGQSANLHYELFENQTPTYTIRSTWGVNQKALCTPTNYEGYTTDFTHSVTLSGFPLLPYIRDYFQNWIAQNSARLTYGTIKDTISGALGILKMNPNNYATADSYLDGGVQSGANQFLGAVDNVINRGIQVYEHSIIPDSFIGSADAGDVAVFGGLKGIYTYCRTIKPEFVDIIDNYFDMFGYATNRLKVPNRNVRPHWCFTQTAGCNIKGKMPQTAINQVMNIYNKGITFWKKPDEIGNYSLDNRV